MAFAPPSQTDVDDPTSAGDVERLRDAATHNMLRFGYRSTVHIVRQRAHDERPHDAPYGMRRSAGRHASTNGDDQRADAESDRPSSGRGRVA